MPRLSNDRIGKVSLGGNVYELKRSRLKRWLRLEELKQKIREAADDGSRDDTVSSIFQYLSAAFTGCDIPWEELSWLEIKKAMFHVQDVNAIRRKFPLLLQKEEERKEAWDYPGRTWYYWVHLLASNYGWNMERIGNLDPDDAVALIQEIIVNTQLEKEWDWVRSDVSYEYDSSAKISRHKPLDRPDWMAYSFPDKIEKVRIRKDLIPVGKVIRNDGIDA